MKKEKVENKMKIISTKLDDVLNPVSLPIRPIDLTGPYPFAPAAAPPPIPLKGIDPPMGLNLL